MLSLFRNLFRGKITFNSQHGQKVSIDKLKSGQAVELKFYDPRELGFMNNNEMSFTRFNADELENRTIQGIVEQVIWQDDIGWVLKVSTFQIRNKEPKFRSYLFLEDEIESIRTLK